MQIKTYQEALRALEDEQQFLLSQGHMKEARDMGCSVDSVVALQLNTQKQSTLDPLFHSVSLFDITVYSSMICNIINPRRACAARVTVVVVCVIQSFCQLSDSLLQS